MPVWHARPPSGASISTRRSAWAHLMWPRRCISALSGGQTASSSGSAIAHDSSPFKTSISILISVSTSGVAVTPIPDAGPCGLLSYWQMIWFATSDFGRSIRGLAAFAASLLAICFADQSALAGKRVALVIGNSNYQNVAALSNPANDAAAITEMFKQASFDVVDSRRDLKSQEMRRALRDFGDKARGADIAVVYFAGHGLEVDGVNYVVPVDAVLERDADVEYEAVSLNRILLAAEPATKLRLVILDACRDNPFAKRMKRTIASRSIGRGLVGVEATRPNTFIAFAAKEGSTAADGDGQNSPFSTALLKHLITPGLDIRKAFGYVRDDVLRATGHH